MIPLTTSYADDPALTTGAAARILGVAISTVQLWMKAGALPWWTTPGGHRRVRHSDVVRLLAGRTGEPDANRVEVQAEFLPLRAPEYPVPGDEAARLQAVGALHMVDTAAERVFDRLTWLAAEMTGSPMALMTILTSRRQWFKSRVGVELLETPRAWAFCGHAILQDAPFMVEDAAHDPRFCANPLVTGEPHIRFYAAVSLVGSTGHRIGTLCVLDREARRLRQRELTALSELAEIASEELKRRG